MLLWQEKERHIEMDMWLPQGMSVGTPGGGCGGGAGVSARMPGFGWGLSTDPHVGEDRVHIKYKAKSKAI